MADVRSMLRAERAARAPPKAAPRKQPTASETTNRKRKASDATAPDDSKRSKFGVFVRAQSASSTGDEEDPNATQEDRINIDHDEPIEAPVVPQTHPSTTSAMPTITNGDVDEDEWAAFERDVVAPSAPSPPPPNPLSIINTNATISAAPMTAAELEAQKKKEGQQAQRILRAEEIEAEKEDAARNLEEEFEEMEALEERVKKLKEKRERLRAGNLESEVFIGASPSLKEARSEEGNEDEEEDDDDEDLEDEWDTWGFGRP